MNGVIPVSVAYHAQLTSAMMGSVTADDLTDHYANLLNLAFSMQKALADAEKRIQELEQTLEKEQKARPGR